MKVCIVCSGNFNGGLEELSKYKSFVFDQGEALQRAGCNVSYFLIKGKGIKGYLKNINTLKKFIKANQFDVIHAHSGLTGLLVSLVINKKMVVTYHGSDINNKIERILSIYPIISSCFNIFVSDDLKDKAYFTSNRKNQVIPCGIDLSMFYEISRSKARKTLKIDQNEKIILFSSSFENPVKNFPLAKTATERLPFKTKIIELKKLERKDVNLLLNAANLLLLTSKTEGSPQIIKEALATNCPIVSLNVGDVANRIKDVSNCFIAEPNAKSISEKIEVCLQRERSNGRNTILELNNNLIAKKIIKIYKTIK